MLLIRRSGLILTLVTVGACSEDADRPADASALDAAATDAGSEVDAGCEPVTPEDPCALVPDPCLPGALELGSGSFGFEPVTPEQDVVPLIHGPQGGYHVFGSLRERGLDVDPGVNALFRFRRVGTCDDMLLPGAELIQIGDASFRNDGDGFRAAYGFLVILDITDPDEIDGGRFVLGAEVTDDAGDQYRDEVEVQVDYQGD